MNPNSSLVFLKRWAPWGLLVLILSAVTFWALMPRSLPVEVGTVTIGRFEQAIDEDGQLRLKNRYVISAPMSAELVRPSLKVGDSIQAGDVVATLTPLPPSMIDERNKRVLQQRVGRDDAARMAAVVQLQRLQTSLLQAELERHRAEKLANDNFIAPAALDQAVLTHRAAVQALAAGQAQLRAAEFTLAESQAALVSSKPNRQAIQNLWDLKSPVNGVVVKLHLASAAPVVPGQPLLEIGDIHVLEAVIDVMSSDARQIPSDAKVLISAGVGAPLLSARVTRIEPVAFTKVSALGIEEQRVNVIIELDQLPEGGQRLGEGFRVDAHITLSSHENVLLVPSAALVREGLRWQVLVYQNGRARAKNVTIQERNADLAWVLPNEKNGVQAGDLVLLYPGTIADGQRVEIKTAKAQR
jgi:HlyD family secretion protein